MKYIILLLLISTNAHANIYIKTENGLLSKDFGWCINGQVFNNNMIQIKTKCSGYVSMTLYEYKELTKCKRVKNHNTVLGSCKGDKYVF